MCFDVPRCSFMFFVYRNPCFLDCFLSESLGPQDKPMACQTSWQQFAPGDCKARFVWLLRIVEKLILLECSINVEKWEGSNMFCLSQKWLETRFLNVSKKALCICMHLYASVCYILDESCASIKAWEITEVFSGENSQTMGRTCLMPLSLFYPFSWKKVAVNLMVSNSYILCFWMESWFFSTSQNHDTRAGECQEPDPFSANTLHGEVDFKHLLCLPNLEHRVKMQPAVHQHHQPAWINCFRSHRDSDQWFLEILSIKLLPDVSRIAAAIWSRWRQLRPPWHHQNSLMTLLWRSRRAIARCMTVHHGDMGYYGLIG